MFDSLLTSNFAKSAAAGVFRHLVTFSGGFLVSHGLLQGNQLNAWIGGGMLFGGVLWSVWQKYGPAILASSMSSTKGVSK